MGNNFYTWAPLEPMYGLIEFKTKTPFFEFLFQKPMYGLSAHLWWAQGEKIKERKEGGFPLHSEFIARKKVVGINYFWTTLSFCTIISK